MDVFGLRDPISYFGAQTQFPPAKQNIKQLQQCTYPLKWKPGTGTTTTTQITQHGQLSTKLPDDTTQPLKCNIPSTCYNTFNTLKVEHLFNK